MLPVRRDLHFKLQTQDIRDWHAQGPYVTQFVNAMSLFFPEGERFFIHCVRHYRDRITDPELKASVAGFIGQEALHGREHDAYNKLLQETGLPAAAIEAKAKQFLDLLRRRLPPAAQLSATIAQEHFTAIISELVLTDPRLIEGAPPRLAALWRWHALEEIEHKAVAFDVYETVMGRGTGAYLLRIGGLLATTTSFLALVLIFQQQLLSASTTRKPREGLGRFLRFMTWSPALLPSLGAPWLAYLHPRFHPWHDDNQHLLWQLDWLTAELEGHPRVTHITAPSIPALNARPRVV